MGPAWFGKIYNKLETILVEVDTFTSQSTLCLNSSDPSEWESVRADPDEYSEDPSSDLKQYHDRLGLPRCDSPSDPPSHQNFDVSGYVGVEEQQVEEDILKEDLSSSSSSSSSDGETLSGASLIQEYCAGNLTSATRHGGEESQISNTLTPQKISANKVGNVEEVRVESFRDYVSTDSQSTTQSSGESFGTVIERNDDPDTLGISIDDSNLNQTETKSSDASVQDNVADMRYSKEEDDVINGKSDAAPLDNTKALAFQEDQSFVDDNALYALHVRTKKLRPLKRKILDALATKRIREKEYEQLAIWFGDANMGSDLVKKDINSKSSQVHASEDSQWELL